jgi:hypothetical protein
MKKLPNAKNTCNASAHYRNHVSSFAVQAIPIGRP